MLGPQVVIQLRNRSTGAAAVPPSVFINKNPRNLERMRLARKQQGWKLESESREYWHRLLFDASHRHTSAHVEHRTGRSVVSASTRELCLRRHLFSAVDVSAAENVGRVLARRCLQAGLTEVHFAATEEELQRSDRLRLFVRAMEEGGVKLQEPSAIQSEPWWSKHREQKPWHVLEEDVIDAR
ncbi:39S ribosomal protein L18, mitochondrial-like [Pollicipes pollicipes]|uniref:39S ribosomal protein L18, mitochondrial-like n=1 Tax=Pollicipes pollicipes TaxID=41117 RepID=UPI0018851498|nr:39S ribosomal protein L18, mitochondrial-like [Pollicipes pollicipes]